MEDCLDFQIDFENLNNINDIVLDQEPQQEDDFYKEILQGDKKAYLCTASGCGKIFKFKSEITRHIIIHQRDRPYVCTFGDCKKNFKRADALENHLRIHEGILPFPCDVPGCDRSFVTKAALRYHKIKHNNDRSFKCEFPGCDKSFIVASQLKQHHKAFPFHINRSVQTFVEENPVKIHKAESKVQTVCCEEVAQPTPKPCNTIQWEVLDQAPEDLTENTQEKFELMFQHILRENKILREQLEGKTKKTVAEISLNFDCQSDDQTPNGKTNEPCSFFDDNELKFLDFLKGRETNF